MTELNNYYIENLPSCVYLLLNTKAAFEHNLQTENTMANNAMS